MILFCYDKLWVFFTNNVEMIIHFSFSTTKWVNIVLHRQEISFEKATYFKNRQFCVALYAYMMIGYNTLSLLHDTWSLAKQISYFIRFMVKYPASHSFRSNGIQILIHNTKILFY